MIKKNIRANISSDRDADLFEYFGAHCVGEQYVFRFSATEADNVFLVGDFNFWSESDRMSCIDEDGIWEVRIDKDRIPPETKYKYKIVRGDNSYMLSDPYAFLCERSSENASMFFDPEQYLWRDKGWSRYKKKTNMRERLPINIYETDLLRWKKNNNRSYSDVASDLAPYVKQMGFTLVCIDFDKENKASAFAPDTYLGTPVKFMAFVDSMHEAGVGVILNLDAFSKAYENAKEANIFVSSISFWVKRYHIDGFLYDETRELIQKSISLESLYDCFFIDKRKTLSREHDSNLDQEFLLDGCDCYTRYSINKMEYAYRSFFSGVNISFMGEEIYQERVSDYGSYVDWGLLENDANSKYQNYISDSNNLFIAYPELCGALSKDENIRIDFSKKVLVSVFETDQKGRYIILLNFSSNQYEAFKLEISSHETFSEIFNSDDVSYGGHGGINDNIIRAEALTNSIIVKLPPTSIVVLSDIKK